MIMTISTAGKEHINEVPNRFNTAEKKKNILKEIDRDESHSHK
jgi:ACT domain-containing protein